MPFIPRKDRKRIDKGDFARTAGERCYLCYKDMIEQWKANPRWTTADNIYEGVSNQVQTDPIMPFYKDYRDWQRARELAWQVFFIQHIMPYERHKLNENGDI